MICRSKFNLQEAADELAELDDALESSAGGDRGQNSTISPSTKSPTDGVRKILCLMVYTKYVHHIELRAFWVVVDVIQQSCFCPVSSHFIPSYPVKPYRILFVLLNPCRTRYRRRLYSCPVSSHLSRLISFRLG